MAKLPFHVAIIFLMIVGCIGPRGIPMNWTESTDQQLLDIFYRTYPPDGRHSERMKQAWDSQLPQYSGLTAGRLAKHVQDLRSNYWKEWQNRSPTEREHVENVLTHIYNTTKNEKPNDGERVLDMFLGYFPQYRKEPELIRTVVYRWYELCVPFGKEISAKDVDWTPEREAYLLDVANEAAKGEGDIASRVKQRWLSAYGHLNVNEMSLLRYVYNIKNRYRHESGERDLRQGMQENRSQLASEEDATQEERFFSKGRKSKWNAQMKADILYIDNKIRNSNVNLAAAIKNRWNRMQTNYTYLSGESLLAHANQLKNLKYNPTPEQLQYAKERYETLPPFPEEVLSKGLGRWRKRKLQLREGQVPEQQHEDEPTSRSSGLKHKQIISLHQNSEGMNASYAGHAYHPPRSFHYGSSSHTPIDQGPISSLPDTSHPHKHFWSTSGSSSHSLIYEDPSGLIAITPRPRRLQPDHRDSSNHTSVHQGSFSSLQDVQYPHEHSWNPEGSSSHTLIHEDPSGLIVVTPGTRRRQPDHRRSSNHT